MLKIKNLQYKYPKNKQIYNYNLSCQSSEIISILGQSGSGKSTFLDLIAGFLEALNGSITLNEKEISKLEVKKRPMSILFQNHNLFEHLSVKKNIILGLEEIQAKKKIKDILKQIGLEGFEDKIASNLSGGQQQRVALARVLLRNKPILLLDEPFTGLDENTKFTILELVQQITKKYNLHTIMITHDIRDANKIASKVYKMENYVLIEDK